MPLRRLLPALAFLLALPHPVQAQLGAIEAFARRVSDLSFYFSVGGVAGSSSALESDAAAVRGFGVELLFEVATIDRPVPGATRPVPTDSVRRVWTGVEVVRSGSRADTVYTYEVVPVPPPPPPTESVWVMEMGIGYGQLQGYELDDADFDMNVSVRDLPAVTLYASYEPWGNYFGLRTGFMKTQALQVVDAAGETFTGTGEAFLFGGVTGVAFPLADLWVFVEAGYTLRNFPSVEWRGGPPASLPRELDMSGWSLSTGLQFPFN